MGRTATVLHTNQPASTTFKSEGHPAVVTAIAEMVATVRELERVAFDLSRNSPTGLFFAQQKLVLLRLANGKPPTRDELVRLAGCACSPGISSELQEGAA